METKSKNENRIRWEDLPGVGQTYNPEVEKNRVTITFTIRGDGAPEWLKNRTSTILARFNIKKDYPLWVENYTAKVEKVA